MLAVTIACGTNSSESAPICAMKNAVEHSGMRAMPGRRERRGQEAIPYFAAAGDVKTRSGIRRFAHT